MQGNVATRPNRVAILISKMSEVEEDQSYPFYHVYNFDYELLTVDQERQTRKLIKYLGLAWHEAFLSPQNNSRGVATASNIQVRKKLYTGSSEKWKNFHKNKMLRYYKTQI